MIPAAIFFASYVVWFFSAVLAGDFSFKNEQNFV